MWTKNIRMSSKKGSSWGLDCVVLKAAVLATQAESEEDKAAAKDFEDADACSDGQGHKRTPWSSTSARLPMRRLVRVAAVALTAPPPAPACLR